MRLPPGWIVRYRFERRPWPVGRIPRVCHRCLDAYFKSVYAPLIAGMR